MDFIFDHFWIIAVIVFAVNIFILHTRFANMTEEFPERKKGYKQIILWYSIILFGGITIFAVADLVYHVDVADTFKKHHPIRYFISGYGILLSVLCLIWIYFFNGVDFLEKHPGLVYAKGFSDYKQVTSRFWLKFIFTAFPLGCIIMSIVKLFA